MHQLGLIFRRSSTKSAKRANLLRQQGLQLLVRQVLRHRRLGVGASWPTSSYSVVAVKLMSEI